MQYCSEACDFGVGHLDGVTGSVVLHLRCDLRLAIELYHAISTALQQASDLSLLPAPAFAVWRP